MRYEYDVGSFFFARCGICHSYPQHSGTTRTAREKKFQRPTLFSRATSRGSALAWDVRRAEPYIKTDEGEMGDWEFYRIPGSGTDEPSFLWAWRCRSADGSVVSAPDTFRFLLDCVAHARLHGYGGGPLLTRRDPAPASAATVAAQPLQNARCAP
jgi:hypothetical protein